MLDQQIDNIKQKLAMAPPLGAKMLFDLGEDGQIFLDGTVSPPVVNKGTGSEEPDTTLTLSRTNLEALVMGTLDPTMAYMTGKLKVSGKMGYAMKLSSLLED